VTRIHLQPLGGLVVSLDGTAPIDTEIDRGAAALLVVLWIRREAVRRSWDVLIVMATMAAALLFVLHFVAYRDMLGQPGDPVLVGRYVLPLVSLWALGIATVASALPRRFAIGFAATIAVTGVLLQLTGLGLTLTRFYA
jgi:hypothetical protein